MKILKYTTLAFVLLMSSCGKGFLEIEPIGQLGKEQLFSDVNGLSSALTGSYNLVSKFFQGQYGIYGDLRGDDVIFLNSSGTQTMLNEYNYNYNEDDDIGATLNIWGDGFEAINNVNNVIENSASIREAYPAENAKIDKIEGEAHILRALMFFGLANIYAQHYTYTSDASHLGIPVLLKTPSPGQKTPRATIKETYAQIIKDLEKGIAMLATENPDPIYASSDAAKGLLSRVYLYMTDYANAIKYASEIIDSKKNQLATAAEYKEMFIGDAQRTDFSSINSEVIWQLNLLELKANYMSSFYGSDVYQAVAKKSFVDLFADNDVRKTLFEVATNNNDFKILKNSAKPTTSNLNWPINFKVIRAAEVILNRAESYYHIKEYDRAVADLKTIQARALNTTVENISVNYTTPEELFELIKVERRKELGFESHRIYDITRYKESLNRGTDCNSGRCSISYPSDIFIMPIPRRELDVNNLIIPNPTVNN